MPYTYSDFKNDLSVSTRGNPVVIYDEDVIIQSLKTIFATVSGERVRNPIGSALIRLLFEPMSSDTVRDIRYELKRVIEIYEPRVDIKNLKVVPNYDQNSYVIDMDFVIAGLSKRMGFRNRLRSLAVN